MDPIQEILNSLDNQPISDFKRKRLNLYKEENAKFEECFTRVELMHDHNSTWDDTDTVEALEQLSSAQQYFDASECTAEAMALSYIEQESQENACLKTLKSDINIYMELNEELENEIKSLTRQIEEAKKILKEVFHIPKDIHIIDKKNAGYEIELEKSEKKHPWLKNPQLELTYIAKEAQTLSGMLEEKEALEKEFTRYEGCCPDKREASLQVHDLKKQYERMTRKINSNL